MEFGFGILRSLACTSDDGVESALATDRIQPRIPLQNLVGEEPLCHNSFEELERRRVLIEPHEVPRHEVHAFGIEGA